MVGAVHVRARFRSSLRLRQGHVPKVLVLSPSALVRFQVKKELNPRGFDVVDGSESDPFVNRLVRTLRPDVILVDASARAASGVRLVKSLKDDPASASTPLLFFSDDTTDSRSQIFAIGADGIAPSRGDFDALAETLTLHIKL